MIAQVTVQSQSTEVLAKDVRKGDIIKNFSGTWKVISRPVKVSGNIEFEVEWVNLPKENGTTTVCFNPNWRFAYLGSDRAA